MGQRYILLVALAQFVSPHVSPTPTPTTHHSDVIRQIVNDPLTGLVATLITAILAIAVTVFLTMRSGERKTITYRTVISKLFSVDDEKALGGRLKIEFDQKQMSIAKLDIDVIFIQFTNIGNKDIGENSNDAIKLSFLKSRAVRLDPDTWQDCVHKAEVLSVDVSEPSVEQMHESGMKAQAQKNPTSDEEGWIGNLLLRKGQSITVRALVKDRNKQLDIINQIPNVTMLNASKTVRTTKPLVTLLSIASGYVGCIAMYQFGSKGFYTVCATTNSPLRRYWTPSIYPG